jgi:hypothetical protein
VWKTISDAIQVRSLNSGLHGCHGKVFASTKMTPFETLYGFPPLRLLEYISGTTKLEAVDIASITSVILVRAFEGTKRPWTDLKMILLHAWFDWMIVLVS